MSRTTKIRLVLYPLLLLSAFLTACVTINPHYFWSKPSTWKDGLIVYEFDRELNPFTAVMALEAMIEWEKRTGAVKFVSRGSEVDYVLISSERHSGCVSYIGRIGGMQELNLGPGCGYAETLHELGHVIGLHHEHQRFDRDKYVSIKFNNLYPTRFVKLQFLIVPFWVYPTKVPYDVNSIMHYDSYAFSLDGSPVIEKKGDGNRFIGWNDRITDFDVQKVLEIYSPFKNLP